MKSLRKPFRRRTRILIPCLLAVSVLIPICILSQRLKHLHSDGSRGSVEDLTVLWFQKHRTDAQKQNAVEENGIEDLKEQGPLVYKDDEHKPSARISLHAENKSSSYFFIAVGNIDLLVENGTNKKVEEKDHIDQGKSSTSVGKSYISKGVHEILSPEETFERKQSLPINLQCDESAQPQSPSEANKKVQMFNDHVIQAKAYLNLAPPDSNLHLLKELKMRIKELEGAVDETKDSALSKRAFQKLKVLDSALSQARRLFPDCSAMVKSLRAMTCNSEDRVEEQKREITFLMELARRTTPKGMHCLSLRLTNEYFNVRSEELEPPKQHRVNDPQLFHFAIFSDNVLACSVVVNSTVSAAKEPGKFVFHIVTDSANVPAISMWFLLNPPGKATIQVQSMDDFQWLSSKYDIILRMRESLDPLYTFELNHLRFYLPDLFPFLNKIVLLEHDVVVQRDLTDLWSIDMKDKVNGAVETCHEGYYPVFHGLDLYINSTYPEAAKSTDLNMCTWAFGLNVFDLQAWRRWNLTEVYHKYLNLGKGRTDFKAGSLSIAWMTFYKHTLALERTWHILRLGHDCGVRRSDIEQGAVIHFDGILKPWLDIGLGKYKEYWWRHVMYDHPFLQQCNIHR